MLSTLWLKNMNGALIREGRLLQTIGYHIGESPPTLPWYCRRYLQFAVEESSVKSFKSVKQNNN